MALCIIELVKEESRKQKTLKSVNCPSFFPVFCDPLLSIHSAFEKANLFQHQPFSGRLYFELVRVVSALNNLTRRNLSRWGLPVPKFENGAVRPFYRPQHWWSFPFLPLRAAVRRSKVNCHLYFMRWESQVFFKLPFWPFISEMTKLFWLRWSIKFGRTGLVLGLCLFVQLWGLINCLFNMVTIMITWMNTTQQLKFLS